MATQPVLSHSRVINLKLKTSFPSMRALAWDGDVLYASRGYSLFRAAISEREVNWEHIACYRPPWWRGITSLHPLSSRLVRDGFHAIAIGHRNLIAAVPGAIATLGPGGNEFQVSRHLLQGTRPLHITALPDGRVFWGEYFDNSARAEVYIYGSSDEGLTWDVVYAFPPGSVRHIHNIIYDQWADRLWVFTGDYEKECRILCASPDWRTVDVVLCGNQQARAVGAVVTERGLYFASDSPLEQNHIYFLSRRGDLRILCPIPSSSIYACRNRGGMYFSTMVEPSEANLTRETVLFGSEDGSRWQRLASWPKDPWSMKFFQYGNIFLPDGENATGWLAASTIAVERADQRMFLWTTSVSDAPRYGSDSATPDALLAML